MTRQKKSYVITTILMLSLFFAASRIAMADGTADCKNIPTDKGAVTGVLDAAAGICAYLGIPYAAPPVGALRFRPPQPPAAWKTTFAADKYGAECIQFPMSLFPSDKTTGSEDCLYANVWHRAGVATGSKPVMVFIHGGGFVTGSGVMDLYHGNNLAAKGDVVVVTINYRLGPFGYMVHPALKDDQGREGNYGMLDQVAALRWVQTNIRNFGGDSGNVTIFGESAGGMSVGLHLISPMSKGLFQKAIVESGPATLIKLTAKEEEAVGLKAAEKLGCGDVKTAAKCLRDVDAVKFITVLKPVMNLLSDSELKNGFPAHPVVDGWFIPDVPLKMYLNGQFNTNVPAMLGTNSDEASFFMVARDIKNQDDFMANFRQDGAVVKKAFGFDVLTDELVPLYPIEAYPNAKKAYSDVVTDVAFSCPTKMLAGILSTKQPKVYEYYFTRPPTNKGIVRDWGAFHGAELPFVFSNFNFLGISFASKANSEFSDRMMTLWSSFARTGVPAVEGAPAWPAYDAKGQAYMQLDNEMKVGNALKENKCNIVEKVLKSNVGM